MAKLKAGLGRTAFQMAQGSRSARAGEPELERFGDIAGCTDAWSVFRSGKIEFELPKYAVFDDANGQAFNYMMSPYSSAATRAGWLGWAAVGGRIWDANYDALDDGAYYPGWQDRGGRTRWFLRHCIQMAFAYRAFVPPEWPPPVSLFSGQGFSCCSGADQTLFKVLAGDVVDEKYGRKAFIKVEQNTSQCPADGDQLIINVRPAKIGAASVLSQLPLLSTSGQPSLRVRCERVYSFTTTSAGQSEAGFRGRSYWRSDDGWIKFCSSFLRGHALVADDFLYWGNMAYWSAMNGWAEDLWSALAYLKAAERCGKVALGSFMGPCTTLVHEIMHRWGSHCDSHCGVAGLAAYWWARSRANLGTPLVERFRGHAPGFQAFDVPSTMESVVDTAFVLPYGTSWSTCDDDGDRAATTTDEIIASKYILTVEFTQPGVAGSPGAFDILTEQVPSPCR